jgi:SAM-dependent methyltransferase
MKPYQHNSGPGVVIGVPTLGRPVPIEWAFALKSMNVPTNYNTIYHLIKNKPVDEARNEFAKLAIEKEAKYLFMIGDDVVIPNHALRQLIYRCEQDSSIGVAAGIYCSKTHPAEPLVYRGNGFGSYWDWKAGEFFEVTGVGMDCTLIRTDLLKQLGDEPFKTVNKDDYLDAINNAESWTEDLYFCHRTLTETKFKIWADGGILCEHWDVEKGVFYHLPSGSLPRRRAVVDTEKKQALIIKYTEGIINVNSEEFAVTTFGPESADYRGHESVLPFADGQFDWVIVHDPGFSLDVREYKRVCKAGGKITIRYHDLVDRTQLLAKIPDSKIVDDFIEITQ